jgi:ABC-type transporter Mla maintaining outer membrane lipid asymmetry permease subunit MlaE
MSRIQKIVSLFSLLFCVIFLVGSIYNINKNAERKQAMQRQFEETYPVGTLVQHRLSTITGVIIGYNQHMLLVRFPSEYAGVQVAIECLPLELIKTKKNILDDKEKE